MYCYYKYNFLFTLFVRAFYFSNENLEMLNYLFVEIFSILKCHEKYYCTVRLLWYWG